MGSPAGCRFKLPMMLANTDCSLARSAKYEGSHPYASTIHSWPGMRYCWASPHSGQNLAFLGIGSPQFRQNFVSAPAAVSGAAPGVAGGAPGGGGPASGPAGGAPPEGAAPGGRTAFIIAWAMASPAPSPAPTPAVPPAPSLPAAIGTDCAT